MPTSRRTPAMLLTLVLTCAATPTPAVAAPALLWDHPGYDAEDSHYQPHATLTGPATKTWQTSLRTNDDSCSGFSTPVRAAGRIHVGDPLGISTYAADTGKHLWHYDWAWPGDNETPRLAVTDGLVIVANGDCTSQSDPDGELLALDTRTGLPRWKQHLDRPVNSVVVDKSVIVISGGSPSDSDAVAAYAARDGRFLWQRENALTSEVSANGTILTRATDGSGVTTGTSAALSITDGGQRWERRATWTAQAADTVNFYATGKNGDLSPVRITDGAPGWTAAGPGNDLIAVDTHRIYRVRGKEVQAVGLTSGKVQWTARQNTEGEQPVRAGHLLFTGGTALAPANGEPAGPAYAGRVIVPGNQIHRVDDGVLTTYGPPR